jgi:protein tyrosine phosphatase
MQNTVYEFWLMVLQNIQKKSSPGAQKIAMLTDFVESQRQKCAVYFPIEQGKCEAFSNTSLPKDEESVRENMEAILRSSESGSELPKISFNYFIIKNNELKQKNGYSIRKLTLYYGNICADRLEQFTIYHYWFPDWPDHRSPQDIDVLLDMSLELLDGDCTKDFEKESEDDQGRKESKCSPDRNPLPIIHCSAGIGRTGCLAAILNGLGQIRGGDGASVDVLGIVCNLRLQRGGMVQNSEQYELIHRSLCLYQQKLKSKK